MKLKKDNMIIWWVLLSIIVFIWGVNRLNFWTWMAWVLFTVMVWTEVWEWLFGPCKYSAVCAYYDKDSKICKNYNAGYGYCGKYCEYEKRKKEN